MAPESCEICGATTPISDAPHLTVNPKDEAGVRDYYVCRPCFQDELEPLFADDPDDGGG